MTKGKQLKLQLTRVKGRRVRVDFKGGEVTSGCRTAFDPGSGSAVGLDRTSGPTVSGQTAEGQSTP